MPWHSIRHVVFTWRNMCAIISCFIAQFLWCHLKRACRWVRDRHSSFTHKQPVYEAGQVSKVQFSLFIYSLKMLIIKKKLNKNESPFHCKRKIQLMRPPPQQRLSPGYTYFNFMVLPLGQYKSDSLSQNGKWFPSENNDGRSAFNLKAGSKLYSSLMTLNPLARLFRNRGNQPNCSKMMVKLLAGFK